MSRLYVKYDGNDINAYNIKIMLALDSKDAAEFELRNPVHENFQSSLPTIDDVIEIYESGSDTLLFYGYISDLTSTNPMKVKCLGYISKMDWKILTDDEGTFVKDQVVVYNNPLSTSLNVQTEEGENPGWTTDLWNPGDQEFYAVITDATLSDSSTTANASAVTLTNISTASGSYSDTSSQDGTYHEMTHTGDATENDIIVDYTINIGSIDKDDSINYIDIQVFIEFKLEYLTAIPLLSPFQFKVYYSKDSTDKTVLLGTFEFDQYSQKTTTEYYGFFLYKGRLENPELVQGTTYYNSPHLIIIHEGNDLGNFKYRDVKINVDFVQYDLSYTTATFDTINQRISDTVAGVSYSIIKCYDDSGVADNYDFNTAGVRANDRVSVCMSLYDAINACFNGLDLNKDINKNKSLGVGIDQNYYGMNRFRAFVSMLQPQDLHFWTEYTSGYPIIRERAIDEDTNNPDIEYIPDATITYSDSNDPPSIVQPIHAQNDLYGEIIVQYRDGLTPAVSTGATSERQLLIKRTDILTLAEALRVANRYAVRYGTRRYSIPLVWNYYPTNLPQVGTKYNIQLPKHNSDDTFTTYTYSNQLCRRITIMQDGANGPWFIQAIFGTSYTPPEEKQALQYKELVLRQELLESNQSLVPVKRHNALLGILGSSDGYHLSASDYNDNATKTYVDTDRAYMCYSLSGSGQTSFAVTLGSGAGNTDIAEIDSTDSTKLVLKKTGRYLVISRLLIKDIVSASYSHVRYTVLFKNGTQIDTLTRRNFTIVDGYDYHNGHAIIAATANNYIQLQWNKGADSGDGNVETVYTLSTYYCRFGVIYLGSD